MREITKLKQKRTWNFQYRGIECEVVSWNFEKPWDGCPSGNWNGYIYINAQQLPDQFNQLLCKKFKTDYKSIPWRWDYFGLESIFNMKGGVTFYQVIRNEFNGTKVGIKVGNDYQHSWDQGRHYEVNHVIADLKKSVDSFIEYFPNYLVWDFKDGLYEKPELLKEVK